MWKALDGWTGPYSLDTSWCDRAEGLLQDGFFIDISSVLFLDFSPSPLGVSLFRVSPCDMGFS
jgi:hypothetical protein